MADVDDLCIWLRNNIADLRTAPDMVTEAPGPTVRLRWHSLATIAGVTYGVGVELHPGPALGEVWLYGPDAADARLHPHRSPVIPHAIRGLLRSILMAHVSSREEDWGRSACLFGPSRPTPTRAGAAQMRDPFNLPTGRW